MRRDPGKNSSTLLAHLDASVSIRGFRVALGEIEACLRTHPSVADAVIVARGDGQDRLIGFLQTEKGSLKSVDEIRAFLRTRLPDYMMPSAFVYVDSLPLAATGKIDRRALEVMAAELPEVSSPFVAAQTEAEKFLAVLWAEILGVERVGIHDNFFELGGHSLLGVKLLAGISQRFGIDLPLRAIFEFPTIAQLAIAMAECQENKTPELLGTEKNQHPGSGPEATVIDEARLQPIDDQKTELTVPIAQRTSASVAAQPTIPRAPQAVELPLSFAEEGLWILEQMRPGMTAWNSQLSVRLRGRLDASLLERSLNALIQRQEILRTTFGFNHGRPARAINSQINLTLPVVELGQSVEIEQAIRQIAADDRQLPFDLSQAPLFRFKLLRLSASEHILLLTEHHIITDAWSSRLFLKELFALYEAFATKHPHTLPDLPVHYSDYAYWVRHQPIREMEDHFSYWKRQLEGFHVVELPRDKQQHPGRTFRGSTQRTQLSLSRSRDLRRLCKEETVTPFMVLLAGFKLLLYRYTGETDIVIGATVAGRNKPELEHLIGNFINLLPLRTDLSRQPTFRELLKRTREVCLEGYEHQDYPFEKLVQELSPTRELSQNPLFRVLFDVFNLPRMPVAIRGLTIERRRRSGGSAAHDLTLRFPESSEGIGLSIDYRMDLYSDPWIAELLEQYKYLLEQVVENPDRRIDDYSLATLSAKRWLPDPTVTLDDSWHGAVHEIFADHAEQRPKLVAVQDPHEAWTYQELNARSNQLAHCLRENGVRTGEIVAIYAHRSAALVWALLGTLKAGGVFCIIDPNHPAARVKEYLSATTPAALIQIAAAGEPAAEMKEVLQSPSLRCRITLPSLATAQASQFLSQYPTENPTVAIGRDDLAYVAFTSGTTGKPKAVLGRHGPLTHFLPWVKDTFSLSQNDRFSLLAGLSSNILQRESLTALSLGAMLCIPSADSVEAFTRVDEWIKEQAISIVHLTPAMAQLLDASSENTISHVRRVFFAGDLLRMRDIEKVRRLMPSADVVNFYNASETQRGGGYIVFAHDDASTRYKEVPPLGHGIKDVQLLVLSHGGQLAGVGELGEICVRSPHLAEGYLGDDQLTTERFITNPFTGLVDDRVYRTGEQGRYLPNGDVEFVARGQDQVSIRGFRVELGEVEAVLTRHPAVREAVVAVREDRTGDNRLVAYVVVKQNAVPTTSELRGYLKKTLPEYMIPPTFMFLQQLPLTSNGKVDRSALPAPDGSRPDMASDFAPPGTALEKVLAQSWAELLGLERVGIQDNFFELGGHSLLAMQVIARIRDVFKVELQLKNLYEEPTIAGLAAALVQASNDPARIEKTALVLLQIAQLSDHQVESMLLEKTSLVGTGDRQ